MSDTKNVSLLGPNAQNDGGERQPQDILSQDSILNSIASLRGMAPATGADQESIQIEGLENFSFVNQPREELELKDQFAEFIEQMRQNELALQQQKTQKQVPAGNQSSGEDHLKYRVAATAEPKVDSVNMSHSIGQENREEA